MYGEAEERQQLKSRGPLLLRHGHHPCPALPALPCALPPPPAPRAPPKVSCEAAAAA